MIKVYFDGACQPTNPNGNMGYGFVIYRNGIKKIMHSSFDHAANGNTNNVAEYKALLLALSWLYKNGYTDDEIEVYGDSQLVINQMNRVWGMKGGAYMAIAKRCLQANEFFKSISYTWIPREQNTEADALSTAEFVRRNISMPLGKK